MKKVMILFLGLTLVACTKKASKEDVTTTTSEKGPKSVATVGAKNCRQSKCTYKMGEDEVILKKTKKNGVYKIAINGETESEVDFMIGNNKEEHHYVVGTEDKVVVLYEFKTGSKKASRAFAIDKKNGSVAWRQGIPGYNFGPPQLKGTKIYMGGKDILTKIDASSGEFDWLNKNTNHAIRFVGGATVKEDKGNIIFTDTAGNTITVDAMTGKNL